MMNRFDFPRIRLALLSLAMAWVATHTTLAQKQASARIHTDKPTFAVSVVKASGPDSPTRSVHFLPGGRFTAQGVNVRLLIKIAYNLNDDELIGGPAWTGIKRFDIDAAPDSPDGDAVDMPRNQLRLQALLADRFQLQMRDEMKTMSTYALVVAKGGPKLKPPQTPSAKMQAHSNTGQLFLTNATLDQFANAVSDWVGHPVLNKTGLDGNYDLRLQWTPDQPSTAADTTDPPANQPAYSSGPTIFTALHQQLGLSLELHKSQALCKVVEGVEMPSEN
jgi:bla regulator protein blaR1